MTVAIASADVGINAQPISFTMDSKGIAKEIVRLTVTNYGPASVGEFDVGACNDHGQLKFTVDGTLAGGCGADNHFACYDFGFGFTFPSLAVHETSSCLVELTSNSTYNLPLSYEIHHESLHAPITRTSISDPNPANDSAILTIQNSAIGTAPTQIPTIGLLGLVLMFGLVILTSIIFNKKRAHKATV